MAKVFISYSRKDKAFVRRLHDALQAHGRETWVDWEGIPASAEWLREVCTAVVAADAVVFVLSPDSVASKVCAQEIAHAAAHNKRLVPIVCRDVEADAVPAEARVLNWIFFRDADDFDKSLDILLSALDTDLDWVRTHTRLLTRAVEWDQNKRDYSFALRGSDLHNAERCLADSGAGKEPRLTPLQIDYILTSRRQASKRQRIALGAVAFGLALVSILGILAWQKRLESRLALAHDFHERGVAALADNNALEAEVLFARALATDDRFQTREFLIQARAKSARLVWNDQGPKGGAILAASPDGRLVARKLGTRIDILDAAGGPPRALAATLEGRSAAFSPDGRWLAVAESKLVEIWDLRDASSAPRTRIAQPQDVLNLAFAGDGRVLAMGGKDRTVSLWDPEAGSAVLALPRDHTDQVQSLAFSPDGRLLVSGSWDNTAKLWDLAARAPRFTLKGHVDAVLSAAFSPDGELIATGGWDNAVWIWDSRTGRRVRVLDGHRGGVLSLAFSPDGTLLASGSEDRSVRLWDALTGKHVLTFQGFGDSVKALAFVGSDGHHRLIAGDNEGTVRLWDLDHVGERPEMVMLRGHADPVSTVAFSPDGRHLASAGWDKKVRLWDMARMTVERELGGHDDAVAAVKFSPDGRWLASAGKDSTVVLRNLATGTVHVLRHDDRGAPVKVRDIAFMPDGRRLASGADDGKIRIWDVEAGTLLHAFAAHDDKVLGLAFSPDGELLASASEDMTIGLWQAPTWELRHRLQGHKDAVWQAAFDPTGRYLVSGSDDRTIRLWNVATGKEAAEPLQFGASVWGVDFSPDGHAIAAGGQDATVRLWTIRDEGGVAAGDPLVLRICDGPVWGLRFNRDPGSPKLAVGSADRTVRVLDMHVLQGLFADPSKLEAEAEEETGLHIVENKSRYDIATVPREHTRIQARKGQQAALPGRHP